MTRRKLFRLLAGLPLVGLVVKATRARFYSVHRGHQGRIFLDGTEVPYGISCKTGSHGWVRSYAVDGNDELDDAGHAPVELRQRGQVEFRPI